MNADPFPSPARRANRRKLWVFAATFVLLALGGLVYSYARPAIYLASARVQINPGAMQVETAVASGGTQGANTPRSLLNELQVLTSRPLVNEALAKLPSGKLEVKLGDKPGEKSAEKSSSASLAGQDLVDTLQAGLEASVAEGTDVVELSSRGTDAGQAAALVNALVATYTRQLADAHTQSTGTALAQARDEVNRLTQKVQAQRRQVDDFRLRHSIVSFEREENEVLGRVKGQTEAITKANEKLAQAEGKLRAMTESSAAGRPIASSARPNATLENMEQRASEAREELSELNRGFTPEYLAMDPRARALRTRLAELERQITAQRQSSNQSAQTDQSAALADAHEEVTAARTAVARTAQQASGNRVELQRFASRFDEFRGLRDALAPQEALLRDATQRLVRQETGEAARRPSVRVLEPAVTPREPWRPQYTRDAAIVLGGALLLALLAMWLVELFNRVDAPPAMVVMPVPGYPTPFPSPYPSHYPTAYPAAYPLPYGAYPALAPYPGQPQDRLGFEPRRDNGPQPTRPATELAGADAGAAWQAESASAAPTSAFSAPSAAPQFAPAPVQASSAAPPVTAPGAVPGVAPTAASAPPAVMSAAAQAVPSTAPAALPVPPAAAPHPAMPRELHQDELAAVLSNASPTVALFAHLLLRGLSPQEATTLSGSDVNTATQTLRIGGAQPSAPARELPLDGGLNDLIFSTFKLTTAGTGQPLLSAGNGGQISLDNLTSELLYAAHDANVDRPGEVTPDALRHTYAAFLARQGMRLVDLARVIGPLSAEQAAAFSAMAPFAHKRPTLDQVQRLMPVLLAQPLSA